MASDIAGRQQCGIGSAKPGARLRHACGGLRKIEVLFQRKRYEARQLRIAKSCPPSSEICAGFRQSLIHRSLALEAFGQGRVRPDVVGADCAAGQQAGHQECDKSVFGQHGILPSVKHVTIIPIGHKLSSLSDWRKLEPMTKTSATTYAASARGPADHEVRNQIVLAATEHFSRYGYEKTSVSDLAKVIGFSKAYIYKFFESKQAIGEMICANCIGQIEAEIKAAIDQADRPPEKLRRMFRAIVESSLKLFSEDRKLYEIATSAATERWQCTLAYEEHIRKLLRDILEGGRQSGDFERKTPLDETVMAIYLVMRPYLNPLILQHSLDYTEDAPGQLSSLVLRSLSP